MSGRGGIYTGPGGQQLHGDGQPVGKPPDRSQRTVKACQICGRISMVSCHHEGRTLETIPMPLERAKQLINAWILTLENEVREIRAHKERYHDS